LRGKGQKINFVVVSTELLVPSYYTFYRNGVPGNSVFRFALCSEEHVGQVGLPSSIALSRLIVEEAQG
jgi:hypothetical protein